MDFNTLNLLGKYAKEYSHAKVRCAGVSDTEHLICTFLYYHSNVSQDTIAKSLKLDKTTVAKALVLLEEKGYISRRQNTENRRKNILSITEKGKEAIFDVVTVYDDWLAAIMSCLSDDEKLKFNEYCSRLLAAAKELSERGYDCSPKNNAERENK